MTLYRTIRYKGHVVILNRPVYHIYQQPPTAHAYLRQGFPIIIKINQVSCTSHCFPAKGRGSGGDKLNNVR